MTHRSAAWIVGSVLGLLAVGCVLGIAAYLVAMPIAEAAIANAWAGRPEIENWANPRAEASRVVFPLAFLVGAAGAAVAAVVIFSRAPGGLGNRPLS